LSHVYRARVGREAGDQPLLGKFAEAVKPVTAYWPTAFQVIE
jgi:hypothetical protein